MLLELTFHANIGARKISKRERETDQSLFYIYICIYVCMYIYISPDFTIVTVLVDRSHTLPRYERFVQCYRVDEGGDKNR